MKLIVLANGDFAAPSFRALAQSGHKIEALFAMPIRGRRRHESAVSAVRQVALDFQIPIFDPPDVNAPEEIELLRSFGADLIFVCDYGKILSKEAISSVRLGGVNLHGSLLPKYRGAAPINRAILDGEMRLGVSVIHITPQVDAGPVIAVDSLETSLDETAVEIEERLARLGTPLLVEAVNRVAAGTAVPVEQTAAEATRAPKIRKEEGHIDWSRTAVTIINQYRAFQPWPKTFADWVRPEKEPVRLILGPIQPAEMTPEMESASAGDVVLAQGGTILVRCGDGVVKIVRVQPAGKREMTAEEFLRGYRMTAGEKLI